MSKLNRLALAACFVPLAATAVPASALPGAFIMPSGYTVRSAKAYGVVCDGSRDDTAAIRSAFSRAPDYTVLEFPAGTCVTSDVVQMTGRNNIMVVGQGQDQTIFRAKTPLRSAFIVAGSSNIVVRDVQIHSPNTTGRNDTTPARGFHIDNSSNVLVANSKIRNVSGAGVLFYRVRNSRMVGNTVENSRADAFHATGISTGILMQYNRAINAGDDCYASIGYGNELNRDVKMLDNYCTNNQASGVSFEGTIGGQAYRNHLDRTGVAGIRIDSQNAYNTGPVENIDLRDNRLTAVRTRTNVGHAAIMVYTDRQPIRGLTFVNNTVENPNTDTGARVFGLNGVFISTVTFQNNRFVRTAGSLGRCFSIEQYTSGINRTGNTLNGATCS